MSVDPDYVSPSSGVCDGKVHKMLLSVWDSYGRNVCPNLFLLPWEHPVKKLPLWFSAGQKDFPLYSCLPRKKLFSMSGSPETAPKGKK